MRDPVVPDVRIRKPPEVRSLFVRSQRAAKDCATLFRFSLILLSCLNSVLATLTLWYFDLPLLPPQLLQQPSRE